MNICYGVNTWVPRSGSCSHFWRTAIQEVLWSSRAMDRHVARVVWAAKSVGHSAASAVWDGGVLKPWDTKKLLVSCKLDQIGIFWWENRWFWGTGTSILRNIQSLKIIGMFINIWLWVKKSGTLLNTDCYGCPSHHSYEIIMYHR